MVTFSVSGGGGGAGGVAMYIQYFTPPYRERVKGPGQQKLKLGGFKVCKWGL